MNTTDLARSISIVDKTEPAPSPFLPGTNIQVAWDSTSLGYMKTCPRLYQYIMIEGWESKDESVHLRFGIEYHSALQDYDIARAEGISHEEAVRETLRAVLERTFGWETDPDTRAGKYKNRGTLVGLILDYLDHFADDPASTVILENGSPAVELSFRFELDWGPKVQPSDINAEWPVEQPYLLSGHLDRVVSFADHLYVMDRKTSMTTLGEYYFAQYEPNNQMTLYTLAAGVVLSSPMRGVIIDAAQILLEKPNRFVRGMTYRTPDQLDEWMESLRVLLAQAESYAIANYWPMNDTACGNYGGCKFREICSKSPQVRDRFLESHFTKRAPEDRWNPLKPR